MIFNEREHAAIVAGLRTLQEALVAGVIAPDDKDIGAILSCSNQVEPMNEIEIDELCDKLLYVR